MERVLETETGVDSSSLAGSVVLVVDDDEDIRTFLLALFADHGAGLCEAADGNEALDVARARQPDLITLDLSMPGRDGVTAFCDLREDPATGDIPVCIVTGHPEFRKVIYERPVKAPEGFLTKPVNPDQLVRTARRILALRSAGLSCCRNTRGFHCANGSNPRPPAISGATVLRAGSGDPCTVERPVGPGPRRALGSVSTGRPRASVRGCRTPLRPVRSPPSPRRW